MVVRRPALLLTLVVATYGVGCGGSKHAEEPAYAPAQPQAYPQPQGYPQPSYQYAQPGATPGAGGDAAPPPPAPSPAPYPARVGTTERDLTTLQGALDAFEEDEIRLGGMLEDETVQLSDAAVCGRVCDALASMRRAADAICELAGEDDDRCGRARDKLESNTTRVSASGCTCS